MVSQTREITCLTLVSRRGVSSWPRKYLETTTLVAICDHDAGISQSFCSKTTSPFSLEMEAVRFSHCTSSKGCVPAVVKRRSTTRPRPSLTAPRDAAGRRRRRVAPAASLGGAEAVMGASEEVEKGTGLSTDGPRFLRETTARTGGSYPHDNHKCAPHYPPFSHI